MILLRRKKKLYFLHLQQIHNVFHKNTMSFNVFRFVFRPVFLKTCMFVHICCNVFHKNTSLSLTFTCFACHNPCASSWPAHFGAAPAPSPAALLLPSPRSLTDWPNPIASPPPHSKSLLPRCSRWVLGPEPDLPRSLTKEKDSSE